MSDFFESDKINEEQTLEAVSEDNTDIADPAEQESTIFSAPEQKKPYTAKSANKKRILSLVAAFLAVAVLVAGTVTVIKLIPEKNNEAEGGDTSNDISVLELDYRLLDKVSVTNGNGKFVFNCARTIEKKDDGEDEITADWTAEGFEDGKLSSLRISDVISSLDVITATREITELSEVDCGLKTPSRKVDIESEKYGNFSVLIGSESPDKAGVYLKLSTKENIYLVDTDEATAFDFASLDLANASGFNGLDTAGLSDYLDEEGKISSFDTLTLSGVNFPTPLVVKPNTDDFLADFIPFMITSPIKQDADKISEVMGIFINGIVSEGAYSLYLNDTELKKVGLDSPDLTVSISLGNVKKTYKISKVDDQYCAVIDENSTLIEKVALSSISFIDYKADDFYSKWVFLRAIDDVNTMVFEVDGKQHRFEISSTKADDITTYTIMYGDKKLNTENFNDFYTEFIGLQAADFNVAQSDTAPEMTVTMTYKTGSTETISFVRTAATKYQYSINGKEIGRITSSAYNRVLKYLKLVIQDKTIK